MNTALLGVLLLGQTLAASIELPAEGADSAGTNLTSYTCYVHGRDSAPGSYPIVRWEWDFGVSGTTTDKEEGEMVTYTYTSSGTYTITLTVTDENGGTANTTKQVVVDPGSDIEDTVYVDLSLDTVKCQGAISRPAYRLGRLRPPGVTHHQRRGGRAV